jgi:CRP/FNR family transcriptional regulator, nitrogen fixation regulation protein
MNPNLRFAMRSTPAHAPDIRAVPPADGLAALDCVGTVMILRRNDVLFREYDPADHYFRVVSGAVRSSKLLADGRRHVSEFYLPGDFIGLDADTSYFFSAEAMADTTVVRYARRKVEALALQEPRIGRQLLSIACHGFSAARQQLVLLGRKTAEERIASFILDLAERIGKADRVSLPMSRTDIGDHLGLTMETVSRSLSHLNSEGIIALESSHQILIRDRDALEDLAEAA